MNDAPPALAATAPVIVLIAGLPCTGKSRLARALAERFRLPLFCKDDFKERMFDAACPDGDYDATITRSFSRLLGRFSMDCLDMTLAQCVRSSVSAVFEANFDSRLFSPRLVALRQKHTFGIVQVHLRCQGDVLLGRFIEREKAERHRGHGGMRYLDEIKPILLRGVDEPLVMGVDDDLIVIDTTDLSAIDTAPLYSVLEKRVAVGSVGPR